MVSQSQLPAAISPNKVKRPSAKVRKAIDFMVYSGLNWKEAALRSSITEKNFRAALNRRDVLGYMAEQREVLRSSAGARAIHRIGELMDKGKSERVQLEAAKYLDGQGKDGSPSVNVQINNNILPGYVIDLSEPDEKAPQIVDLEANGSKALQAPPDVPTQDVGTRPHPPKSQEKEQGRGG